MCDRKSLKAMVVIGVLLCAGVPAVFAQSNPPRQDGQRLGLPERNAVGQNDLNNEQIIRQLQEEVRHLQQQLQAMESRNVQRDRNDGRQDADGRINPKSEDRVDRRTPKMDNVRSEGLKAPAMSPDESHRTDRADNMDNRKEPMAARMPQGRPHFQLSQRDHGMRGETRAQACMADEPCTDESPRALVVRARMLLNEAMLLLDKAESPRMERPPLEPMDRRYQSGPGSQDGQAMPHGPAPTRMNRFGRGGPDIR